jgi:hypothetical protein
MFGLAFLNGTLLSFDQPARGALVPRLVRRFGPALAGFGIATLGYTGNFFLNAAGALNTLYVIRVPPGPINQQSTLHAIRSALGTPKRDAVLPWIVSG